MFTSPESVLVFWYSLADVMENVRSEPIACLLSIPLQFVFMVQVTFKLINEISIPCCNWSDSAHHLR